MTFKELVETYRSSTGREPITQNTHVLSFDPGFTTGVASFKGLELTHAFEIDTSTLELATPSLIECFSEYNPEVVVIEAYRIYKWRAKQHANSEVYTARLIGALEMMCIERHTPYRKQAANVAKNFCTDAKLHEWDVYYTGQKHARDAIRHGCYYIMFHDRPGSHTKRQKPQMTVG